METAADARTNNLMRGGRGRLPAEPIRRTKHCGLLSLSCVALAVAGAIPGSSLAAPTIVYSQADLINAIQAANLAATGNAIIQLGSSFSVTGTLPTATTAITLDTQTFTLTGSLLTWSGAPLTFAGTLAGIAGGGGTTGAGLQLTNSAGGTSGINNAAITGGSAAAGQAGGTGLVMNFGTLVNNNTITGGGSTTTGAGANGAQIGHGATLINNGTIQGGNSNGGFEANSTGVNWGAGGATLINHGTIRGGSDLTGANVGGTAIFTRAGVSPIVNTGTLVGGNGALAVAGNVATSLINSGTIQAGSGQATAIQLSGIGALSLELQAGSHIVGNVVGNTASTANTFTLGGTANDVFDVSSIGAAAQYRNFNVYQKTGTSTWALTGTGTASTPWSIQQGTLQIGNGGASGSVVGTITDNATLAFNRSDTATFGNLITGTGGVDQLGSGTTILTAANTYTGDTNVLAGALAIGDAAHPNASIASGQTTVAAGASLGGYGTVSGSVNNNGTIAAANALAAFAAGGTGAFNIGGNLNNAGIVSLAAASGGIGNVLNVAGNYTGTNGLVVFNTLLNAGGAASLTDRLVVSGNAAGTTAIKVNPSGTSALTAGDGIQLVQVNGTSTANSFRLAAPVQASAFQYLLYQGGTSSANSWYLRSQLISAAQARQPSASMASSAPIAYRPAVVGYSITPQLNADYSFSILGRLHERGGDAASADTAQPAHSDGVWGRIGGQNLDADASDRFSADEHTFFAQFGKDWTLSRDAGGSTHAGAMLTFGSSSASFSDSARSIAGLPNATGTVEAQAQSIGGYWTKYLPDGAYFDGVGQLTHYRNRYGDVFGGNASQDGFSAGVSGEIGKPFSLGATGVAIEPQAQLLYQYLHLGSMDDGISAVGSNTTNALRGRIGLRLFKANLSNDSKTSSVTPWLTADVLHDFFSPGQTTIGGTAFDNALAKTWYEIGVGITGRFGKNSEVYVNAKYAHSFGSTYRRNIYGQAGYRFNW